MCRCYYSKSSMSTLLFVEGRTIFEVLGNNCPLRFLLTSEWLPALRTGRQDDGHGVETKEMPTELLDSKIWATIFQYPFWKCIDWWVIQSPVLLWVLKKTTKNTQRNKTPQSVCFQDVHLGRGWQATFWVKKLCLVFLQSQHGRPSLCLLLCKAGFACWIVLNLEPAMSRTFRHRSKSATK